MDWDSGAGVSGELQLPLLIEFDMAVFEFKIKKMSLEKESRHRTQHCWRSRLKHFSGTRPVAIDDRSRADAW